MQYITFFYYWTWFVWPFVFVFGLAFGIANIIKGGNYWGGLIWSGLALLITIQGLFMAPLFS